MHFAIINRSAYLNIYSFIEWALLFQRSRSQYFFFQANRRKDEIKFRKETLALVSIYTTGTNTLK